MANLTQEEKDQLKAQLGLGPYEKRLGRLTQSSNEYRAWCPWHEKNPAGHKSPSLAIFPSKENGGEYCFRCLTGAAETCGDKKGDLFTFVEAFDNVKFGVALRRVQHEAGISSETARAGVEEPTQRGPEFEYKDDEGQAMLRQNPEVMEYLAGRGIDDATIMAAGIGLCDYPKLGPALAIPYGDGTYKFRSIKPAPGKKFRHKLGTSTDDLLYGIDRLDDFDTTVYVTESELDCLMMKAHGYTAVSVGSATTCLDKGKLKIKREYLDKLHAMDCKIVLVLDQDKAGRECAKAFADEFPSWQLLDVTWPYEPDLKDEWLPGGVKVDLHEPKDIGEVYEINPTDFKVHLDAFVAEAKVRPPAWQAKYHTVEELPQGDIDSYIEGILEEGITFIGSLSGVGKSLFAFSMAKALTTGRAFLKVYPVKKQCNVLYLCPEMGAKALRIRARKFGLGGAAFRISTMKDGVTDFNDPLLADALAAMRPVVFLDTAIRFTDRVDENSAAENAGGLAKAIFRLINLGACAVVGLHHAPKAADSQPMTKENLLRGTGDLSAMCDNVWGLRWDDGNNTGGPSGENVHKEQSKELTRLFVKCLKPRDINPVAPFIIQGRPYIDDSGDFALLLNEHGAPTKDKADDLLVQALKDGMAEQDPQKRADLLNMKTLAAKSGTSRNRVKQRAKRLGWHCDKEGLWVETRMFPTDDTADLQSCGAAPVAGNGAGPVIAALKTDPY